MHSMTGPGTEPDLARTRTVLWVIWGTITAALPIYVLVAYMVRSTGSTAPTAPVLPILTQVLGFLALVETVAIFALRASLARRISLQGYSVLRWAMVEAIGLFGLVLYLLGASWGTAGAFFLGAFVLQILLAPTQRAELEYQRLAGRSLVPGQP